KDQSLIEVWNGQCVQQNISLLVRPSEIIDRENPRAGHILSSYTQYLYQQRNQIGSLDPLNWVDNHLQEQGKKGLSAVEKATLYDIDTDFRCGTEGRDHLGLEMIGLEIESQIPDTISPMYAEQNRPGAILDRIEHLDAGCYKLSFPTYDF